MAMCGRVESYQVVDWEEVVVEEVTSLAVEEIAEVGRAAVERMVEGSLRQDLRSGHIHSHRGMIVMFIIGEHGTSTDWTRYLVQGVVLGMHGQRHFKILALQHAKQQLPASIVTGLPPIMVA